MTTDRRILEFLSSEGVDYDIYINDTSHSPPVLESTLGDYGFKLNYPVQSGTSPRTQNFLPSSVSIPFKVQNSGEQAVITALKTAAEDRFKVRIEREGSIFWSGFILTDSISWEDNGYNDREWTINAVDGIGRLKDIPYNNNGAAYTGRATVLAHVFNCLDKIPLNYFYNASEAFLKVIVNWYEDQHAVTSTLDPLVVTDIPHSVFYKLEKNKKVYKSCHEVLEYLLQMFGARLYLSDGVWRFEQFNERENAVFTEFVYDKDQAHISTDLAATYEATAVGTGTTLPRRLSGGNFPYYQPLDSVSITYNHNGSENIALGTVFNYSLVGGLNNQGDETLGNIDLGGGIETISVSGKVNFKSNWNIVQSQPTYRHEWKLKIKVGNYYLKRTISNQGQVFYYDAPEWTTTESWYWLSTNNLFQPGTLPEDTLISSSVSFSFETPQVPEAGDIIIDFFWAQCVGINYQVYGTSLPQTDFAISYYLVDHEVRILQDGEQANMETSRLYEVTNDSTGNTSKVELETPFGDGPYSTTFNKMKVYDGAAWQISNDWRVDDTGTAYQLQELVIREILAGQKTSIERYTGELYGEIYAHTRILVDSTYYLFQGGTFTANYDRFQGNWFEITRDATGITTQTPVPEGPTQTEFPGSSGLTGGGGGPSEPVGGVAVETQSPVQTTAPIIAGFVESVGIPGGTLVPYAVGDVVQIVNPLNGATDTVTVSVAPAIGDTVLQIDTYVSNSYPNGASIIPIASEVVPEAQTSGEVVGEFFTAGTVDKEDYYLKTNILLTKQFLLSGASYELFAAPLDWFFRIPTELDGAQIEEVFTGVATAGSGGSTTIDLKLNGSTFNTSTILTATTYIKDVLATPQALSEGDVLTAEITAVPSTSPLGLDMSLRIGNQPIYLDKIEYQLNRVLRDGLILWYNMNYQPQIPITYGSLAFDSGTYIDCGADSTLNITADLTISTWVKFNDFTTTDVLVSKYESSTGFELVTIGAYIRVDFDTQTTCSFATSGMDINKWYHLAATYDGTNAKLYLDGVLQVTTAYTAPSTIATNFRIAANGGAGTPGNFFTGSQTSVRLWSRALTINEIQSTLLKRYDKLTAAEKVDLVSAWELSDYDSTGTDIIDSHGSNTGTVT